MGRIELPTPSLPKKYSTIVTAAFTPVGALAPANKPLCVILVFLPAVLIGMLPIVTRLLAAALAGPHDR